MKWNTEIKKVNEKKTEKKRKRWKEWKCRRKEKELKIIK